MFNSFKRNKKKNGEIENKNRPNELESSINYLLNESCLTNGTNKYQDLIYLQKIICNSIVYHDYAYSTIRNPHSATNQLGLTSFMPNNDKNYRRIPLSKHPIFLDSTKTPFIIMPWNNEKIIDNICNIGTDVGNKFDNSNPNVDNFYIYPLGIAIVASGGNHSHFAAILKNDMSQIKINCLYDVSDELNRSNADSFDNFYGSRIKNDEIYDKWLSIMKIGKHLLNTDAFPEEIQNVIDQKWFK